MATVSTDSQLKEVAVRIREMREICGISEADMAQKTEVSTEEYRLYEEGKKDFPFFLPTLLPARVRVSRPRKRTESRYRTWLRFSERR